MLTVDFDRLDIAPRVRVLDVGAGAGRHSFEALRRGAEVIALDLDHRLMRDNTAMAAAMAANGEAGSGAGFAGVRADALTLPFADESFDVVIACEVLEHIADDRTAIAEMRRVLADDGRLAVSVPRWWPERLCWALSRPYHDKAGGHVRIYRSHDLIDKLTKVGFAVEGSHHAHALHSPYWWLKCLVGPDNDRSFAVRAYKRFLEWDIVARPRSVRAVERALDPVLGKSLVLYLRKLPEAVALAA